MKNIREYINQAYRRWLDYATYHAERARLHGQGQDLLHTVLESLLKKNPGFLEQLFSKKKGIYTELDYYVLRMIKLNATSKTSPYRHKNKGLPIDSNKDPWRMDILDEDPEGEIYSERILHLMRRSREVLANLDISPGEREIFIWKFYGAQSLKSWPGPESYSAVCKIYNQVLDLMKENGDITTHQLKIRKFSSIIVQVKPTLQHRFKVQRFASILSRISCRRAA